MPNTEKLIKYITETYGDRYIPIHKPKIWGDEAEAVSKQIAKGDIAIGENLENFENTLRKFIGCKHVILTNSGTSALHVLLYALKDNFDVAYVPNYTFVATANAVKYLGKRVELYSNIGHGRAYIPDDKRNLDIVACLMGHNGSSETKNHIYDCCQALGAKDQDGKHTGQNGHGGVLSFNGNKIITCGSGGAVFTDNPEIANRVKHLIDQAKSGFGYHDEVGFNYRMNNIQATFGLAQLSHIHEILEWKRKQANIYAELGAVPHPEGSNCWLNIIELTAELLQAFTDNDIEVKSFYRPLSRMPMYRNPLLPILEKEYICLPSWIP